MLRRLQQLLTVVALAAVVNSAHGFALLGPFDTWQATRIGYNIGPPFNTDVGGPQNLGEEYRWNLRTITFGFDNTFKNYFGQRGMEEVRKAMAILNGVPPMSKLSTDLREYPTDSRRVNYRASSLQLLDLKSYALGTMMEMLGLASPERYVWSLRFRIEPAPVEYHIIQRNFDPVTLAPSSYVNDTLYTYTIIEFGTQPPVADAVELPVDPLQFQYTAVASTIDSQFGGFLNYGDFLTGLTRDDIGGLRYLYTGGKKSRYRNSNIEGLVSDVVTNGAFVAGGGAAWTPVTSNAPVVNALRSGIERLVFKETQYDSELGFFVVRTNSYRDSYITNSHEISQTIQRVVAEPDIIFGASDLGDGILSRSSGGTTTGGTATTALFVNNAAINGQVVLNGPGIISPPIFIVFSKTGHELINVDPNFLEEDASSSFYWGSFDGTTNEPVIYPIGTSIFDTEAAVFRRR